MSGNERLLPPKRRHHDENSALTRTKAQRSCACPGRTGNMRPTQSVVTAHCVTRGLKRNGKNNLILKAVRGNQARNFASRERAWLNSFPNLANLTSADGNMLEPGSEFPARPQPSILTRVTPWAGSTWSRTRKTSTASIQDDQQMAILRFASSQQGTKKTPTWQRARFRSVCPWPALRPLVRLLICLRPRLEFSLSCPRN